MMITNDVAQIKRNNYPLVLALNVSEQGPGGLISVVVNVNVMEVVL